MSLLFIERPLVVNPRLAKAIGLNEAIILQQMHYWLSSTGAGVEHDGRQWIYNTLEQWQEQFPFWSIDTIKRAIAGLRKAGIVEVQQLNKRKHDHTNFYTIRYGHTSLSDEGKLPYSKVAECSDVTETTTETTTENKNPCRQEAGDGYRFRFSEIRDAYNRICAPILPACRADTAIRKAQARKMVDLEFNGKRPFREHGLPMWESYFRDCLTNKHWIGENDRGWRADFDFVTNPKNAIKLLERICG